MTAMEGQSLRADLHLHSRWSDGSLPIPALLELAKRLGLGCVAITDHDTLAGQAQAAAAAQDLGIHLIAGVEISARLMLNAVNDGLLSLEKLVALMSENPARIWNLEGRGKIEVGQPANITVVDLKRQGVIRDAQLHGKSNVTAFDGVNTVGMPVYSVLRGKLHDLSV